MAIDFGMPTFGSRFAQQQAGRSQDGAASAPVRKPSEFWINVGLPTGVSDDKFSFLSLPLGIPLDTMNPVELRGTNQEFLEFRAAQNHLLEQVLKAAKNLRPGESTELNLMVQLRRISGDPVAPTTNRFLQKLAEPVVGHVAAPAG
jgi:hypothetical protein